MKLVEAAAGREDTGMICRSSLHLDHGPDFETCKACIDGGFTSVMIDGSHLPFEENIELTRRWSSMRTTTALWSRASWARLAGVEDDVKVGDDDALLHRSRRG